MKQENLIKFIIVVMSGVMAILVLFRPNINQEFHNAYADNLVQMRALSKQLTLDILRAHLGYVQHYDFIEANLQKMEKSAQLVLLAPGFVSDEYKAKRETLINNYLDSLDNIRENVDNIKSKIGLVRNSQRRSMAISREISESSPDAKVLAGMLRYQQLLDANASESVVLSHLNQLISDGTSHSVELQGLMPHAGILSRFRPDLMILVNDTNKRLSNTGITDELADLYQSQYTTAVNKTTLFLWVLLAFGATFVALTLYLIRLTQKAQITATEKNLEIEQKVKDSQHAVRICTDVLSSIAKGDFAHRVTDDIDGELNDLKTAVNTTADQVESTISEVTRVLNSIENGQFDVELDQSVEGSFRTAVDSLVNTFKNTFSEITKVMQSMNQGEFDQRIVLQADGELDKVTRAINGSMEALENSLREITSVLIEQKNGNLLDRVTTQYPGQLRTLSDSVNVSLNNLQNTFIEIQEVTDQVQHASAQISQGNLDLTNQTRRAMGNINSASDSVREMTDGMLRISNHAVKADELANNANCKAADGRTIVSEAVKAMEQINDSSHKISDIIGVIDSIAFQTNLLALNASVEAARAGEQGRGFAVVASEVRNLAGRSADAAREIKALIEDSAAKVEHGTLVVNQSGNTLDEIANQIQTVLDTVSSISGICTNQHGTIEIVQSALDSLETVAEENVRSADAATKHSDQSVERVTRLKEKIDFFQTRQENYSGLKKAA